jgi:hypothetical protein
VVPATTRTAANAGILRAGVVIGKAGMERDSDLLLGRVTAVANESFPQESGSTSPVTMQELIAA